MTFMNQVLSGRGRGGLWILILHSHSSLFGSLVSFFEFLESFCSQYEGNNYEALVCVFINFFQHSLTFFFGYKYIVHFTATTNVTIVVYFHAWKSHPLKTHPLGQETGARNLLLGPFCFPPPVLETTTSSHDVLKTSDPQE